MYNIAKIYNSFKSLVGFRQLKDPDVQKLDSNLLLSDSGLFVQDAYQGLFTDEAISKAFNDFENQTYPTWNSVTTYSKDEYINFEDNIYKSLINSNVNFQPDTSLTEWELQFEFQTLSTKLREIKESAINRMVTEFVNLFKINTNNVSTSFSKTLLSKQAIYVSTARVRDLEVKRGRFCGVQVTPARFEGINFIIDRIGLHFNAVQTNLPIYLYHSSSIEPLAIWNITTVSNNRIYWFTPDADNVLSYYNELHDMGGSFYIGYYEDDLAGQAIVKKYDYSGRTYSGYGCSSCNAQDTKAYRNWSRFADVKSFTALPADDAPNIFDVGSIGNDINNNYGLNLSFSVQCDITQILIDNRLLFADALNKYIALDLAKVMGTNTQTDATSAKIRVLAIKAMQKDGIANVGLEEETKRAVMAVNIDFSNMNTPCLPKKNNGVRIKSIY